VVPSFLPASGLHWDMVVDLRGGGFAEVDDAKINVNGNLPIRISRLFERIILNISSRR
jgi:hypothetical protein